MSILVVIVDALLVGGDKATSTHIHQVVVPYVSSNNFVGAVNVCVRSFTKFCCLRFLVNLFKFHVSDLVNERKLFSRLLYLLMCFNFLLWR